MLLDRKWERKKRKKNDRRKEGIFIATFCSAINDDDEEPEGRETFR